MAAVQNNSHGCLKGDNLQRLRRFLCLGNDGGTYFVQDILLGAENAQCIINLVNEGMGEEVIEELKRVSEDRSAPKQDTIIFALALCTCLDHLKTKQAAYRALPQICSIPTHLFHFVDCIQKLDINSGGKPRSGHWGRGMRRAINKWYNSKDPKVLAEAVTKYKQRKGWSHTDLLRLAHVKPVNEAVGAVLKYVIKGLDEAKKEYGKDDATDDIKCALRYLEAVEMVRHSTDGHQVARHIEQYRLSYEHVPTGLHKSKEVWQALLPDMPLVTLIRNLGKMTSMGLLQPQSDQAKIVIEKIVNKETIKAARLHPLSILVASHVYKLGKGEKGKLSWVPIPGIVDALEEAFLASIKNVLPTNKRYLIAIDVGPTTMKSKFGYHSNNHLPAAMTAAAMAMITAQSEKDYQLAMIGQDLLPIKITTEMKLPQVLQAFDEVSRPIPYTSNPALQATDCSLPVMSALRSKTPVDVFVIYTDCMVWSNPMVTEVLRQYRKEMDIPNARLVICAMNGSRYSLSDPNDPYMMDIAGFDATAPDVIRNFVMGNI